MHTSLYTSPEWQQLRARVLVRDGNRCVLGRLGGGPCHASLHVHHIVPVSEGGAPLDDGNCVTVCKTHHPAVEALRRRLLAEPPRCGHYHPYPQGRAECERRLRQRQYAA